MVYRPEQSGRISVRGCCRREHIRFMQEKHENPRVTTHFRHMGDRIAHIWEAFTSWRVEVVIEDSSMILFSFILGGIWYYVGGKMPWIPHEGV